MWALSSRGRGRATKCYHFVLSCCLFICLDIIFYVYCFCPVDSLSLLIMHIWITIILTSGSGSSSILWSEPGSNLQNCKLWCYDDDWFQSIRYHANLKFIVKIPVFLQYRATCSRLPSNTSTMILFDMTISLSLFLCWICSFLSLVNEKRDLWETSQYGFMREAAKVLFF